MIWCHLARYYSISVAKPTTCHNFKGQESTLSGTSAPISTIQQSSHNTLMQVQSPLLLLAFKTTHSCLVQPPYPGRLLQFHQEATQHNQPAYPLATLQTWGCTRATRIESTKKGFVTPTPRPLQHSTSPHQENLRVLTLIISCNSSLTKVSKKGIYRLGAARLATLGPSRCAPITYTSGQVLLSQAFVAAAVPHLQLTHHTAAAGPQLPQ